MSETYQLLIQKGPRQGEVLPLSQEMLTIGRDPMADVVVLDGEVSRYHARLTRQADGHYQILDLGSTNGTFINGERLGATAVDLNPGEVLNLGDSVLILYERATGQGAAPEMPNLETVMIMPPPPAPVAYADTADELVADEVPTTITEVAEVETDLEAATAIMPRQDVAAAVDPLQTLADIAPQSVPVAPAPVQPQPSFTPSEPAPIVPAAPAIPSFEAFSKSSEAPSTPFAPDPLEEKGLFKGPNRNLHIALAILVGFIILCCCCILAVFAPLVALGQYASIPWEQTLLLL